MSNIIRGKLSMENKYRITIREHCHRDGASYTLEIKDLENNIRPLA